MKNYSNHQNDLAEDADSINAMATDWLFLNLFFRNAAPEQALKVVDPFVECEICLKAVLQKGGYSEILPLSVCADQDVYFDIWLDDHGTIRTSDLFMDEGLEEGNL